MQESSTIRFPRWLWIIPAIPLLLLILSVVLQSLSSPTRGPIDLGFYAVAIVFLLALVVGFVMLVIILIRVSGGGSVFHSLKPGWRLSSLFWTSLFR